MKQFLKPLVNKRRVVYVFVSHVFFRKQFRYLIHSQTANAGHKAINLRHFLYIIMAGVIICCGIAVSETWVPAVSLAVTLYLHYVSVSISMSMTMCLYVCLFIRRLSVCLFIRLSLRLFVIVSLCGSLCLYLFVSVCFNDLHFTIFIVCMRRVF